MVEVSAQARLDLSSAAKSGDLAACNRAAFALYGLSVDEQAVLRDQILTSMIDIEGRLQDAIQSYWDARAKNKQKQVESGRIDAGTRGEVTGGTQMGALEVLVADILCEAGLTRLDVRTRTALELPGYFRATKKWDLIVVSEGRLVLAMELKSQAGKSIGNNVNNRAEEAVGSAKDLWTAYREGRFGRDAPPPFLGYLFLLEDRDGVKRPVANKQPYFSVDPVFRGVAVPGNKTPPQAPRHFVRRAL